MNQQHTTITSKDGVELDAIYTEIDNSHKAVLFAHGMTSSKDLELVNIETEKRLNAAGITTLRFDFRAHGNSPGDSVKDFTVSGSLYDLEGVVSFVKEKQYSWVGLVGCSFGGGIASLFSGAHADLVQALCLVNPVLDYEETFLAPSTPWAKKYFTNAQQRLEKDGFIEIGSRNYKIGLNLLEDMKEYSPYEMLEKYYGPLLILQGTNDQILNHQDIYTQFINLESDNKRIEIINGAEHGLNTEPYTQEAAELMADFFVSPA